MAVVSLLAAIYVNLLATANHGAYENALSACEARGNPYAPCWNQLLYHWNFWWPF